MTYAFYHVLELPSVRLGRWLYTRMQAGSAPRPRVRRRIA